MPKVIIIIVNYNEDKLIINCLKSLKKQSFKNFNIVIIDNSSSEKLLDKIQGFINENQIENNVKLICLKKNLGFAGGNLEGLKNEECEYVATLNNDTEPHEKWLEELVKIMDSEEKIGICASKIIIYGTVLIDSAGDEFSKSLKGFKRGEKENIELYEKGKYVFGACAGAALYRKKMIDEIGFFDNDFFLIHEDTDLNFRAQLFGWKVFYVPTAIVYHKVRSSIGQMSDIAVYYSIRNTEFVRIKNVPFGVLLKCFPQFLIGTIMEFIYFGIKHRHLKLYLKAKIDAIKMLPKMLKKRSIIMRNRKVDNKYLLSIMTPIWEKNFMKSKIRKLFYA